MIVIDFSGIAVANIFVQHSHDELGEDMLRHMVLNSICMYNKKFSKDYGHIFIACDCGSWRKDVFKFYKANRKIGREASTIDWDEVFGWLDKIKQELVDFSPYTVLTVQNAEADDIIAQLCHRTQEFGQCEDVMIVSSDKDFKQLQRYSNVQQFSNLLKKFMKEPNPYHYLFEHICKGDASDGVPNIFSPDDILVTEGKRQTPVSTKKIESYWEAGCAGKKVPWAKEEHERNFQRNRRLIDLTCIPKEVRDRIDTEIDAQDKRSRPIDQNNFLNYLIKNRCTQLIERLPEFF